MWKLTGSYADLGVVRLYFESSGSGQPIVCIHATGADRRQWRYFGEHFSDMNVFALDLPGHGKTLPLDYDSVNYDSASGRPTLREYAEIVWRFVKRIKLRHPTLVGSTMGGNISLILGVEHPKDIKAIVCVGGGGKTMVHGPHAPPVGLEWPPRGVASTNTKTNCSTKTSVSKIKEIDWLRHSAPPSIYANDVVTFNSHNILDELHLIDCPVLLLRGTEDAIISREMLSETCDRIKDCTSVELEDCGHWPMIENPRIFNQEVSKFLFKL